MTDYEILKSIEAIDLNNVFLKYIVKRVQSDNYRGIQCSQHNRLTYNYFKSLLEVIYQKAGDAEFFIHVGDDKGVKQPDATIYYDVVKAIKQKVGKGTINSVKKNTFPDLARAGLLNRYDKKGNLIKECFSVGIAKPVQQRHRIFKVGLSALGMKFVNAQLEFERRKYYTDAVDMLTKNVAAEMVELLSTDERFDSIDILEFMYIISDDRSEIHYNDKIFLLSEYRKLSAMQKEKVTDLLKLYCDPNKRVANKLDARDYGNWKNESQQIFGLLANSTYFKVIENTIILNNGEFGLFVEEAKRSNKPKAEYFRYHNVTKRNNYELHHIIPFQKAVNQADAKWIDDERNLIYLSVEKHLEFTSRQNINIKTAFNNPNILFLQLDSDQDFILVNIEKSDALVSREKIHEIVEYNQRLIKKFYHT